MQRTLSAAIGLGLLSSVIAAAPSGTLSGTITDSEGGSIAAHVVVHHDISGSQNLRSREDTTLKADRNGRFRVQLEPAFYDLCVMADAFTPQCSNEVV